MTTNARTLFAAATAAALAGCAGMPGFGRVSPDPAVTAMPAIAPSATARISGELAIERWWTVFGDRNLDRLIVEALARNEDIEAAIARVREAQASLDIAGAALSPTLDLRAETGKSQRSTVTTMPLPPGVDRRGASNTLSLAAGYELDLWGRLASTTAAARSQLLATEWARSAVEWGVTARVAEAYFGLAAVERQIEISEAVRASRLATLKLRQREHEVGAGNEFDLRRAEAEVTATDASLASLARERVSLERALTVLLGRTPNEIVTGSLPRAVLDERKAFEAALPRGTAADLLVRRPDIRQAEAQLAAANSSIDAARAATLPAVRLSGILGTDARSVGNLFSGPAAIWSLAANASQSILDGGRLKARVREEHARAEQAVANYRKTVAGAVLDVREAYAALDIAQQAIDAERQRVAALARARELARLGFDNGALSYLDLLDAERNWYQAQLNEVAAYRDRLTAQVAAFKALGGGYTAPADRHALR
ncbi:MAG TPA: efflux transporter outer membrane subunit [Burkholderiales bacterium]|nr:efflux transporter outer membrane subunit [Burkholderiales bacterium]